MSGIFDLDTEGAAALDERARLNPLDPSQLPPPAWTGAGQSLKGLLRPSAATGRSILMAGAPVAILADEARTFGRDVADVAEVFRNPWLQPSEQAPETGAQDWYFRNVVDEVGSHAVEAWTADPMTMGAAAKALNVGSNVIGTLPQLFGTPSLFLASAGLDPATELTRQGVDTNTALAVGGVSLAVNAAGLRLPAAFGSTLTARVATGAGANLALGTAADVTSSAVLEAGGYEALAAGYNVTDPYARGLDLLMGVAFGYKAHIDAPKVMTPAQRESVLVAKNNDHLTRGTLPGDPVNARAARDNTAAVEQALRQLALGEKVDVAGMIDPAAYKLPPGQRIEVAPAAMPSATFDAAVSRVLRDEGGFADGPADRGGATNFGISSKANPDVDVANLTEDGAKAIYRERYWDAIDAENLPETLRGTAFDAAVNQGVGWTKQALAEADGDPAQFNRLREARYREIVANDPSQAKFMRGWLNRLGRYKDTDAAGEALRERLVSDPEQLTRDYAALEESRGGTVLNTDTARELSPEYLTDRTRSADVHEAASDTIKTIYEAKLAKPTPEGLDNLVLFTAGGTGAGKTTGLQARGDAYGTPEIIYDTNMNTLSSSIEKVEQALAAGRDVQIAYVYRDPVDALTGGAIPRARRQAEKFGSGRTVPLDEHAKTHIGVRPTIEALAERYKGNPRVQIMAIDNSRGRDQHTLVELANLPRVEETNLREHLQTALEDARAAGLDESLYRGFAAAGRPAGGGLAGDLGAHAGTTRGPARSGGESVPVTAVETPTQAAAKLAAESPDLPVIDGFDADGNPRYRPMSEALAEIEAERTRAQTEAQAFPAAVNCFLRRGG